MKLLHDVCMVEVLDEPYVGSLVLPDNRRPEGIVKAKVTATGNRFRHGDDINVNDIVLVSDYVGTRLTLKGKQVRIYDGEDILAKIL